MSRHNGLSDMEWLGEEELGEEEAGLYESPGLYENWETGLQEGDQFFGGLLKKLPMGGMLQNLARKAAIAAGSALGGPSGGKLANMIANQVLRESETGLSMESETEPEAVFEAAGGDMEILNEMNYLAEVLAESDNEHEADHFLGAIASLAGPLLSSVLGETQYESEAGLMEAGLYETGQMENPSLESESDQFLPFIPLAAKLLPKALPFLKKGIQAIGRTIVRNPQVRRVVRRLPRIALGTVNQLARAAQANRPITKRMVLGSLARQAVKAINSPATVRVIRQPGIQNTAPHISSGSYVAGLPRRRRRRMVCYY